MRVRHTGGSQQACQKGAVLSTVTLQLQLVGRLAFWLDGRVSRTVGLKIGAHFFFVSLISQRVFNFRSPTIAYDNPQLQQIVISYSIFVGEYVSLKLWGTQNL